jgi:hypothetical protein
MTEYVWCMDTRNRIVRENEYNTANPTNDICIRPQLSVNRMTVTAIELASLELPRVQRLIESDWSRFYLYTGFPLFAPAGQTIRIKDCCYEYTASIPYILNNIISIDDTDSTAPIFETTSPHFLSLCVDSWDFGDPVQVIGLPLPVILTNSHELEIISPTVFQVKGFPFGTTWVLNPQTTNFGYLYYPQLPSPLEVARLLTKGLNASFEQRTNSPCLAFLVTYDKLTSRFCISLSSSVVRTKGLDFIREAVLLVEGPCSLATLLGFNQCNHPFSTQPKPFTVCAPQAPYGTTFIEVSPGAYLAHQLADALGECYNANYFAPRPLTLTKSTDIPPNLYVLSIGTTSGSVVQINIPAGGYTPLTLSKTISHLLTDAWPAGELSLAWNKERMTFVFSSETSTPFSLEFQSTGLTNIATQLGFSCFRYSGEIEYESDEPINAGLLNESCQTIPMRFNSAVCNVIDNTNSRTLTFNFSSIPPLPITDTMLDAEMGLLRITNLQQAHGLQVNDVVNIGIRNQTFLFPVVLVANGTEFVVALGTVVLPDNDIPTEGKTLVNVQDQNLISIDSIEHTFLIGEVVIFACEGVRYVGTVANVTSTTTEISIYPNVLPLSCFGLVTPSKQVSVTGEVTVRNMQAPRISMLVSGNNPCSIEPLILGFGRQDVLWEGSHVFESPYVYRLQASTYILLEMVYPVGSARIEHRFNNDNRTTILGKIVTLADPYLERFYPMKATFFTGIKLDYCQFRLLNPDHTLYQLHGHNWQATFRLYTPQLLECV